MEKTNFPASLIKRSACASVGFGSTDEAPRRVSCFPFKHDCAFSLHFLASDVSSVSSLAPAKVAAIAKDSFTSFSTSSRGTRVGLRPSFFASRKILPAFVSQTSPRETHRRRRSRRARSKSVTRSSETAGNVTGGGCTTRGSATTDPLLPAFFLPPRFFSFCASAFSFSR